MNIIDIRPYFSILFLVFSAYLFLTLSPGPANMAIMTTSMRQGRRSGIALACGVLTGSQLWTNLAALGVTSLIITFPLALKIISLIRGLYFLGFRIKPLAPP